MQPAPPDFYTLSLHDALPISRPPSIGQEPRTVNRSLSTWRLTALMATLVLAGCSGDSSTGVLALAGPGAGGGGTTGGTGGGGTPSGTTGVNDSELKILATNLGSPYNVVVDAN